MTPESLRVKQWREMNRDRYNESQRILMAKRRREMGTGKRKLKKINSDGSDTTTV